MVGHEVNGVPLFPARWMFAPGARIASRPGPDISNATTFFGRYLEVSPGARPVWTHDESDDATVTTVSFHSMECRDGRAVGRTSRHPGGERMTVMCRAHRPRLISRPRETARRDGFRTSRSRIADPWVREAIGDLLRAAQAASGPARESGYPGDFEQLTGARRLLPERTHGSDLCQAVRE